MAGRHRPTPRSLPATARLWSRVLVAVGFLGSALLVWHTSYAAFSSISATGSNSFAAGSVTISTDMTGAVLFSVTGIKPDGVPNYKCVKVTSTSTVASVVKVYGTAATASNGLNQALNLTVEEGPATATTTSGTCGGTWTGSTQIYSGTLLAFGTGRTDYATGAGTWAPATTGSPTKVYRFGVTMPTTATTGQGLSTSMTFNWEAQNT